MINTGIIGYGYWGVNLVRNFMHTADANLLMLCDTRPDRLVLAQKTYPNLHCTTSPDDLFTDTRIDALVIATPVHTHFALAKKAILQGKHILVEKPFTSTAAEADILMDLAAQKGVTIMLDHTFLFTSAVQRLKTMVESGELGKLQYFDSVRINLGLFQSDVNVLTDLAPHDLSILQYLIPEKPISVSATGISHTTNGIENIAYLTLHYANNFIAHLNCSWVSPLKIRRILLGGSQKMILYDDVEPTEKLKIYDTGYTTEQEQQKLQIDYRIGDIFIPKLLQKEALAEMANHFVQSILNKKTPLTDAKSGYEMMRILDAAALSMQKKGDVVYL